MSDSKRSSWREIDPDVAGAIDIMSTDLGPFRPTKDGIDVGLTFPEGIFPRGELRETRRWFAWYPVRCRDGGRAWMRFVTAKRYERVVTQDRGGMALQWKWYYWREA